MIEYTTAPWQISKDDYGISRIYSTTEDGAPFYVASGIVRDADARLIRLAPQMYEALLTISSVAAAVWRLDLGVNKAFEQTAEIAREVLAKVPTDSTL
jgi:hypothetical protein